MSNLYIATNINGKCAFDSNTNFVVIFEEGSLH